MHLISTNQNSGLIDRVMVGGNPVRAFPLQHPKEQEREHGKGQRTSVKVFRTTGQEHMHTE